VTTKQQQNLLCARTLKYTQLFKKQIAEKLFFFGEQVGIQILQTKINYSNISPNVFIQTETQRKKKTKKHIIMETITYINFQRKKE
jgi:hypothetical protein